MDDSWGTTLVAHKGTNKFKLVFVLSDWLILWVQPITEYDFNSGEPAGANNTNEKYVEDVSGNGYDGNLDDEKELIYEAREEEECHCAICDKFFKS